MRYTWKTAPHLGNCATLRKIRHTWKSAAHLEKCGTLGEIRHPYKNAAHLEKCATLLTKAPHLEKCGTLGKMFRTLKMRNTSKSAAQLKQCGTLDQDALKWFKSYLTSRMQRCNLNNHLSSASPLNCGVPQGSIIGPRLYLIYVNDLPNCLNVGTPRMYADDTNVTFSAATIPDLESQINRDLKYIDRWLKANKLGLDVSKTEFMVYDLWSTIYGLRSMVYGLWFVENELGII